MANEGPCPIELTVDSKLKTDMHGTHFALGNTYFLAADMGLELTTVGASATRRFPSLTITATLRRRPQFYLLNVGLPTSVLALMASLQFTVPHDAVGDRLGFSLTLVLTVISSKYAAVCPCTAHVEPA